MANGKGGWTRSWYFYSAWYVDILKDQTIQMNCSGKCKKTWNTFVSSKSWPFVSLLSLVVSKLLYLGAKLAILVGFGLAPSDWELRSKVVGSIPNLGGYFSTPDCKKNKQGILSIKKDMSKSKEFVWELLTIWKTKFNSQSLVQRLEV